MNISPHDAARSFLWPHTVPRTSVPESIYPYILLSFQIRQKTNDIENKIPCNDKNVQKNIRVILEYGRKILYSLRLADTYV